MSQSDAEDAIDELLEINHIMDDDQYHDDVENLLNALQIYIREHP